MSRIMRRIARGVPPWHLPDLELCQDCELPEGECTCAADKRDLRDEEPHEENK